jgi:hypothetical protein
MTAAKQFIAVPTNRLVLFTGTIAFIVGIVVTIFLDSGRADEAYAHGKMFGECNAVAADRIAKIGHQPKPQYEGAPFIPDDTGCAIQYAEAAW